MDFMEAVKAKKQDFNREIRRHNLVWELGVDLFKYYDDGRDSNDTLNFEDIEATDWIVKEKKTLSEQVERGIQEPGHISVRNYREEHIKKALKRFMDRFSNEISQIPPPYTLANEVFGEQLMRFD
jgi:hypothetical protein